MMYDNSYKKDSHPKEMKPIAETAVNYFSAVEDNLYCFSLLCTSI